MLIDKSTGEPFGGELGKKYSYTIGNGGFYYHWNKSNDRKLNNPDFNWNGYFDIPEPINYKSSHRPTGKTEKVQFPGSKKHGIEPVIKEIPQSEPTGYLTPRFRFINIQINRYGFKGDEYKQALETFGISENGTIPPEKLPVISNYRDTLLKQLQRQAEQINELNRQIANVLKVYYYESEQAILKGDSDDYPDQRVKDRNKVLRDIRNLFETLILRGAKTDLIERHSMLEKLKTNKYISDQLIDATIHGILTLSQKKDPLINMAIQLSHKINPLESVLEDAILSDRIKPNKEYLKENLSKGEIIQKAHDLKENGMKVEDMFNEMKNWLITELEFSNDELQYRFGFRFHEHGEAHDTFNKFVNKNRFKHN